MIPQQRDRLQGRPGLLLRALWRYKWLGFAVVMVAAAAGYFATAAIPPVYRATTDLLLREGVAPPGETRLRAADPQRYLSNEAAFMQSRPVLEPLAEELEGVSDAEELREQVEVTVAADADVLQISATARNGPQAARIANGVVSTYEQLSLRREEERIDALAAELQQLIEGVQQQIDLVQAELRTRPENATLLAERDNLIAQRVSLQVRQQDVLADAALTASRSELLEPAAVPTQPSSPIPARSAAVAAALAALLFAAGAVWRAERSLPASRSSDPVAVLGAPLLAEFSHVLETSTSKTAPVLPDASEPYRFLQAAIHRELARYDGRTVVFTSIDGAATRSTVALKVAVAAGRTGRSVVLVDADQRARVLTTSFEAGEWPGLAELVSTDCAIEACMYPLEDDGRVVVVDGRPVQFVPVGSSSSDGVSFFTVDRFQDVVDRFADRAELVFIDGPSLATGSAAVVARAGEGVVVVVRRGDSLRELAQLREQLDLLGVPILGYAYVRNRPA